jgi:hypothetical protein
MNVSSIQGPTQAVLDRIQAAIADRDGPIFDFDSERLLLVLVIASKGEIARWNLEPCADVTEARDRAARYLRGAATARADMLRALLPPEVLADLDTAMAAVAPTKH